MSTVSLVPEQAITSQTTALEGYVGFDTITQQIEKKLLKRGFHFNVMVVGKYD
jgi:septin 3/9/12